jgi:hypothetical protein
VIHGTTRERNAALPHDVQAAPDREALTDVRRA